MVNRQQTEARISHNPSILGGKPIIRGTRIAVSLVADWIDAGVSIEQILDDYPNLTRDDIEAAITYAQLERAHLDARST